MMVQMRRCPPMTMRRVANRAKAHQAKVAKVTTMMVQMRRYPATTMMVVTLPATTMVETLLVVQARALAARAAERARVTITTTMPMPLQAITTTTAVTQSSRWMQDRWPSCGAERIFLVLYVVKQEPDPLYSERRKNSMASTISPVHACSD